MWRSFAFCALFAGSSLLWCLPVIVFAEEPTAGEANDDDDPFSPTPQKPSTPAEPRLPTGGVKLSDAEPVTRKEIKRALARKISIEFVEIPLAKVVEVLAEKIGVPIMLDERQLNPVGIGSDTTITRNIDNIAGRGQLSLILDTLGLAYLVEDGFISITSPEVAAKRLRTKVFPVGDLIKSTNAFNESVEDPTWLIELIPKNVVALTWDQNGGPGTIAFSGGNLIVTQTDDVLDVINSLLAKIRTLRDALQVRPLPMSIAVDDYLALGDAIREQLRQPVSVDFVEMPLFDVIEKLKALLKIEMQLDYRAMEDAGIESDNPVTFSCKSLYADVALRRLLERYDLKYIAAGEVLLITTPEVNEAATTLRLYPVRDLIDPHRLGEAAYDDLIEAMVSCIAPSTWDETGGLGTIDPVVNAGAFLVGQTEENHRVLAKMIQDLRAENVTAEAQDGSNKANYVTQVYRLPQFAFGAPQPSKAAVNAPDVKVEDQAKNNKLPDDAAAVVAPSDLAEVIELIKKYVDPQSWGQDDEVYIRTVHRDLLIRQRPIVHAKIEKLLMELNLISNPDSGGHGMSGGIGFQ
jgi:hypothetical protein